MHPSIYKRPLLWLLLAWIAGILLFYKPLLPPADLTPFISKDSVSLVGEVDSFPVFKGNTQQVILEIPSVNNRPVKGRVYARLIGQPIGWKDTISLEGKLTKPYGVDLIGNFNWNSFLARKQIFAEIKTDQISLIKKAPCLQRFLFEIRQSILSVFTQNFPPDLAAIASGIVLGERTQLKPSLYTAFQDSGTIHLLVASGGNVGFITLLTFLVCGLFYIPRKYALSLSLISAGFYTCLAGADAPLLRAYFMTVCASVGFLLGRNSGIFQGLILSAFLLLIKTPDLLFDSGFQMSFLATVAIVFVAANFKIPSSWPRVFRFLVPIFAATLASQLALLPIFTNVFYKVSLIGLVSNLLLVPLSSVLLGLGVSFYVATLLKIGFIIYFPFFGGLCVFKFLVEFFASLPFSAVSVSSWQATTIGAYFIGLFLLFNLPVKGFFRKAGPIGIFVMCILLSVSYFSQKHTYIYLLDEWGKNTVIVNEPSGQTFVFGNEISADKIQKALYKTGRKSVTGYFSFFAKKPKMELASKIPVGKTYIAFEDAWPETTWMFGKTSLTLKWGRVCRFSNDCTEQKGYSGTKHDKISYCISSPSAHFCIGANGSFIEQGNNLIFAQRNKTLKLKI